MATSMVSTRSVETGILYQLNPKDLGFENKSLASIALLPMDRPVINVGGFTGFLIELIATADAAGAAGTASLRLDAYSSQTPAVKLLDGFVLASGFQLFGATTTRSILAWGWGVAGVALAQAGTPTVATGLSTLVSGLGAIKLYVDVTAGHNGGNAVGNLYLKAWK